eukprot:5946235-Pyramimonas_sp.AAC.1
MAQNIRAYKLLAQPVPSHASQVYFINDRVAIAEHAALQKLTAAPRHSIATALLMNLDQLGIDAVPRDIASENEVALYRAAVRSSVFSHISVRFHRVERCDTDVLLVARMSQWRLKSIAFTWLENYRRLTAIAPRLADED